MRIKMQIIVLTELKRRNTIKRSIQAYSLRRVACSASTNCIPWFQRYIIVTTWYLTLPYLEIWCNVPAIIMALTDRDFHNKTSNWDESPIPSTPYFILVFTLNLDLVTSHSIIKTHTYNIIIRVTIKVFRFYKWSLHYSCLFHLAEQPCHLIYQTVNITLKTLDVPMWLGYSAIYIKCVIIHFFFIVRKFSCIPVVLSGTPG